MVIPRVILVSSSDLIEIDNETVFLKKALTKRGINASIESWDDPNVDWSEAELAISRTTSTYLWQGNTQKFLEWTKKTEKQTTLWNSRKLIEWNYQKTYLLQLQKQGIPMPKTMMIPQNTSQSINEILEEIPWNDFILKAMLGAGSCGLKRFTKESPDLETHFNKLNKIGYTTVYSFGELMFDPSDTIIQPYIPEITSLGEVSMIFFGGRYSHSVIKRVKEGDFRAHPIWGASVELYTPSESEIEVCYKALSLAPDDSHYARIDLVPSVSGPLLIELELVDPMLFFDHLPNTVESFADHIENSL